MTTILFTILLVFTLPDGPTSSRPNFSGTWRANFAKSKLQIKRPDSTVFTIEHCEPRFKLSRTHTFEGKSDTWGIELTTDGKEVVLHEAQRTIRARLTWQGDALVFDVKLELPGGPGSDVVRYCLSRDGKTFSATERYRDAQFSYENVWIFDRTK